MPPPSLSRWFRRASHWLGQRPRGDAAQAWWLRAGWLPLFVGVLSLAVTGWLWRHEYQVRRELLQSAFHASLRQLSGRIDQRLASYEQMLRGAQGLLAAKGPLSPPEFERYMDSLLAGSNHTGLRALAYHPAPGVPAELAGTRLSAPGQPGDPGHFAGNPWLDPQLRPAMLQARDAGQVALSGRVALVPRAGHPTGSGFLMFLPVYRGEAGSRQDGLATPGLGLAPAARQARLVGWVWATFSVEDMMSSLYGERVPGLGLSLYEGVTPEPGALMYQASGSQPDEGGDAVAASAPPEDEGSAPMEAQEYLALAGRSWTLVVRSEPEFERRMGGGAARTIAAAGLVLSLLLAVLTSQLQRGRAQALRLARFATGELRESEARYRRIVETTSEGIWMLDAEGRTSFANPRLALMLGWPLRALQGQPLGDFLTADSPPLPQLPWLHEGAPAPGGDQTGPAAALPTLQCELCLCRADGQLLWAELSFSCIPAAAGQPPGALAMVSDITARKQAEREQARLEAQLRESQKLEAIGTLAGGIAHDFNNILAAILGNVALARQQLAAGQGERSAHECLGRIEESGSRARSLVQQILAFSRQQAPALLSQPLQPLVEEAARLLRATLPAGVQLELALSSSPLPVRADATQIQQVLMNLCTNAWHAMNGRGNGRNSGRIEIGLAAQSLSAPLPERLAGLAPGDYARLWVSDDGCGMSADTLARLFEPFFTTKGVGHGTGLGLAVVHGIVATHRGSITVDSSPGAGSCFTLYLPLADEPVAQPPSAPAPAPAGTAGQGEHVLVVDDDPAIGLIVERLLQTAGYRVTLFEQSPAALTELRHNAAAYDLLLSDFNMPELSGLELAQASAELRPELPVVISSGYLSDEVRQAAREAGVKALLQKEFSVEQLPALVRRVLDERPKRPPA